MQPDGARCALTQYSNSTIIEMNMSKPEQVMSFESSELIKLKPLIDLSSGFAFDPEHHYKGLVNHANRRWLPRSWCETKPYYKQVIPYCILHTKDLVYQYQRVDVEEKRLSGKWSLGIGGHIV